MKKLYRSTTDVKLAGVCAGLAEYFELDPTVVRLGTVLISLFSDVGVIAYVVAALLIPQK